VQSSSAVQSSAPVTLSQAPLGIDIAPWDGVYSAPATLGVVQPLLKAAGIRVLHYGGGTTADEYDWQTGTDIQGCPDTSPAEFTAACATTDPLDFSSFSQHARAIGAQSMVTVNYGTGWPSLAAAWVAAADSTAGQAVADWEIGNESYGCWEADNELASPPANYSGYVPNSRPTCPMSRLGVASGMQLMAGSYAAHAKQFMMAMTAQDPTAKLGVPWAFDKRVRGSTVQDNGTWNDTVLGQDGKYVSFVDAHWYPFGFGGDTGSGTNPADQAVIQSVEQIPADMSYIRSELAKYVPHAQVIVGETGVSYLATNVPCKPAGALFAAGDALSWLAAGAQSIDWWPLDTGANPGAACSNPDEAMFTGTAAPNTPYTGYLLASVLAQPGAKLSELTTSDPTVVLAFQSQLPTGQVAVALINTSSSAATTVRVSTLLADNLSTVSYRAAGQNPANTKTATGRTTVAAIGGGITLPAESILVLKGPGRKPSAMTLGTSGTGTTVTAGSRVTLAGKLTLGGAPAPAGVPVAISRQLSGSAARPATWTVRTTSGGRFTVTDVPPGVGTYKYTASYRSNTYVTAAKSVLLHVVSATPALARRFRA
jgi:hypothetical protein